MLIFDVCGTLYRVNTTFTFVVFYHRYRRNRIRFFLSLLCSSLFGKILNRFFGFSVREFIIRTIKGERLEDLQYVADVYVFSYLKGKEIEAIFMRFLEADKKHGVILVSASIDVVIDALANKLGVKAYSSKLEFIGNKATGELSEDLKGNKQQIVKKVSGGEGVFYTDNLDDLSCADYVGELCLVVRRSRLVEGLEVRDNVRFLYI